MKSIRRDKKLLPASVSSEEINKEKVKIIFKLLSVFSYLFILVFTLTGSVLLLIFSFLRMKRVTDVLILFWARTSNFLARATVVVQGQENIPEGPCLFVFNHASMMDISVLFVSIPRRIRFGAKKELFYVPVFGWALQALGMLEIDRGNRLRAINTLKKAVSRLQSGEHFILAAEGTRQKDTKIGDFKSGPFILAIDAKVPIVPVVIEGVHSVLPKNALFFQIEKRHVINVEILKPQPTHSYTFENRHELKSLTQTLMVNSFENLKTSRIIT